MSVVKKSVATIEINILYNSRKKQKKNSFIVGSSRKKEKWSAFRKHDHGISRFKKKKPFGKVTLTIGVESKDNAKCNEKKKTNDSTTEEKPKMNTGDEENPKKNTDDSAAEDSCSLLTIPDNKTAAKLFAD